MQYPFLLIINSEIETNVCTVFYSLAGATAASFSLILLICYLLPDLIALNFHSFYLLLVKGIYMVHYPIEQNVSAKVFDYLMNLNFNLPIRIFFKRNRFCYR